MKAVAEGLLTPERPTRRSVVLRAAGAALLGALARRRVTGLEHIPIAGPCLLVFNQASVFDVPLLYVLVPRWDITRLTRTADGAALRAALQALRRGGVVGVAGEGRRNPTGALGRGHGGAALLARRARVPIVPVAIANTAHIGTDLRRLRRARVTVRVGEPFVLPHATRPRSRETRRDDTDRIMCRIAELASPALSRRLRRAPLPGRVVRSAPSMIPRGRIDIGWPDLAAGALACAAPGRRADEEARLQSLWSPSGDAVVCLSVRSGLDTLLAALAWPPGTEVLVSAITIRDMVRIVQEHGLVPVPVDLDMDTLAVTTRSLSRALSPRTKAVLVAHLFGSRMPLEHVARFARAHGLLLIEDCAQSFTGLGYRGSEASDVSMFSFGPIKTSTALGGALLRIRDGALRARMQAVQAAYPVQGRWGFFTRVLRFSVLRLLMQRPAYTLLCAACRLRGRSHDEVISLSARGFSGPDFFANIRRRPSLPLLKLLRRRLVRFDGVRVARRSAAAEVVLSLAPGVPRPGREATCHSYWAFPIHTQAPDDVVRRLWERGFDATRGTWSLYCLPAPAAGPHLEATAAREAMRGIVYLPVYPEVGARDLERLAATIREMEDGGATERVDR